MCNREKTRAEREKEKKEVRASEKKQLTSQALTLSTIFSTKNQEAVYYKGQVFENEATLSDPGLMETLEYD